MDLCSRREFVKKISRGVGVLGMGCQLLGADNFFGLSRRALAFASEPYLKEAMYYEKLKDLRIECQICPRKCQIADQERGYCGVKENRAGNYYTLVHSRPCTIHADPIEKKPLFHYIPGSRALSLATAGCNMECKFCQNWQIAQFRPEQIRSYHLPPRDVIGLAKKENCNTIAYTYSEPVVFYEYMYDIARVGSQEGIGRVMISNGYINEEPLIELCKYLSAVKIDLKAFTEKFYRETCHGELKPVKKTLQILSKIGIWYEIVVLIVPTLNDSEKEIKEMCLWIRDSLGSDVPVHFSRFHPTYKIKNLPPTPVNTLEWVRKVAMEIGLNYVYLGNIPGHPGENTYCPGCGKMLIKRVGFNILQNSLMKGRCPHCDYSISGVWE